MCDVPCELCREIFLRLPAKTLFRFRSVCKSWLRMIDDPAFIKAHTDNQVCSHTLLVRNETGDPLFSFSLDSLNYTKGPQKIDASYVQQVTHRGTPVLQKELFCISSCNGLILMHHWKIHRVWTIWNPLTGDCHRLPRPSPDFGLKGGMLEAFGVGYDRAADDYKVVRIDKELSAGNVVYNTLVYSMKSESWTMTEACPCEPWISRGTCCNGTLYWTGEDDVIALNLGTLTYRQLPLPPDGMGYGGRLDAFDGCLVCSFDNHPKRKFDGWIMGEAGVWTKLFSLEKPICYGTEDMTLVAYLKGKEQVVVQYSVGFLWFDIRSDYLMQFSVHDFPDLNSSRVCPGSLVRLDIRAGAAGHGTFTAGWTLRSKRKRNTGITDNRLKFCVRAAYEHCCSDSCGEGWCRYSKE